MLMARKSTSKKKKDKPKYDEDGKWVDQDNRILSGIRRAYRLSPQMQETLQAARVELPPKILKSGKPGKRNQIRYRCAVCEVLFSQKNVQVDHISSATPLWTSVKEMSWDDVVDGIFCGTDNLQVLCSTAKIRNGGLPSCHAKKSAEENYIRKLIKKDLESSLDRDNLIKTFKTPHNSKMLIESYKEKYQEFLAEKEEKRLAKEERKRIREEKRKAKK